MAWVAMLIADTVQEVLVMVPVETVVTLDHVVVQVLAAVAAAELLLYMD